jgi:DNA-binding transcriptional LysR family regulator
MNISPLRNVDLNLLLVLRSLLETGSVTKTATKLNMSQPAVSRALAKLRNQLEDPILVKGDRGMVLTPRAEALDGPLRQILQDLEVFFDKPDFDPGESTRVFRIITTDYGALAVLPSLLDAFSNAAPGAAIETIPFTDGAFNQLVNGGADLLLYTDDPVPDYLMARTLFSDEYVCLARTGHPVLRELSEGEPIPLDLYLQQAHILISVFGGRRGVVDTALEKLDVSRKISLWLPYFSTGLVLASCSDLIVTMPRRTRRAMVSNGLVEIPLPVEIQPFDYRLVWHERIQNDAGFVWFREFVSRHSRQAGP